MNKKAACLGILFTILFMLSACTHPSDPEALSTDWASQLDSSDLNVKNADVLEENEYYKILHTDFMYYYTIFDQDHNIVKSDGPLNRKPHIVVIDNYLVRFTLQAGTGMGTQWGYYYNIQTDEFSDIFQSIYDQCNGKVAYAESGKVIIRDIFGVNKYYYEISSFEYPFSIVAEAITNINFVNDGASVEISYLSGENYLEITETIDLFNSLYKS